MALTWYLFLAKLLHSVKMAHSRKVAVDKEKAEAKKKAEEAAAEEQAAKKKHCSHVGPHLGTRVPMGTFFSFWVPKRSPFSFQGPHFPYFRLKNALKVTAAIVY